MSDEMKKRFNYWKRNMSRDGDFIGTMPSFVSWEAGWNAALKYGDVRPAPTNTGILSASQVDAITQRLGEECKYENDTITYHKVVELLRQLQHT